MTLLTLRASPLLAKACSDALWCLKSCFDGPEGARAGRFFECARIVQVITAVAIELPPACEIDRLTVPSPEPRVVSLRALWLFSTVLIPLQLQWNPKDASVLAACAKKPRLGKGPDIHANAVVDIRFPTDRLLVERFPANEKIVG